MEEKKPLNVSSKNTLQYIHERKKKANPLFQNKLELHLFLSLHSYPINNCSSITMLMLPPF